MQKIIIKKRYLDCVKKQRQNKQLSSCFPRDFDARLKRIIELREEFADIIQFSSDIIKNCEDYLDALENENYEICNKFYIES